MATLVGGERSLHRSPHFSKVMSVETMIESSMQIRVLLNLKQAEPDSEDEEERQEEEGEADEVQLFADERFDPEFRVSTWEQTILGKLL